MEPKKYFSLEDNLSAENDELRSALKEMLEAFSMKNIGLEASKRRLEAKKQARAALKQ